MEIKEVFRRYCSSPLPVLMLSFAAATGLFGARVEAQENDAPPPPATPLQQAASTFRSVTPQQASPHTFWKHPDYDAVLEVWAAPDGSLRGKVAALNPDDKKIKKLVGKILKKDEPQVSRDDIMSFQGMEGELHLHPDGAGKWSGTIYSPYRKKSYGVEVEQSAEKMHVFGFLLLQPIFGIPVPHIGKSVDLLPGKMPAAKEPPGKETVATNTLPPATPPKPKT